jgi:neuron navigator 2
VHALLVHSNHCSIDPVASLNLNALDSILGYYAADTWHALYAKTMQQQSNKMPIKLLPRTSVIRLSVVLRGTTDNCVDALSFDTLIPKTNLQRLLAQLLDQQRLVLCGSCGTGKTYLARKLADYIVEKHAPAAAVDVITLTADENADDVLARRFTELRTHTSGVRVLLIDNLQYVHSYAVAFEALAGVAHPPYIIGTLNQSTPITALQIEHNFRFVLWANHIDPVKGFLGRYLRRRLMVDEARRGARAPADVQRLIDFLPKVLAHVNRFLETANSPDVTIGPRLLLACPLGSVDESRKWFVQLWNTTIMPYVTRAAREGLQMFGKRGLHAHARILVIWRVLAGSLEDPTEFVCDEWPWSDDDTLPDAVLQRLTTKELTDTADTQVKKKDPLVRAKRTRGRTLLYTHRSC